MSKQTHNYVIEFWKGNSLYTFVIQAVNKKSARINFKNVRGHNIPIKSIRKIPDYIDEIEYGEHIKKISGYPSYLLEM